MRFLELFRKRRGVGRPLWDDRIAIYRHISDNLDPQSGRLIESAYKLPDDQKRFKPGQLRWMDGAMDGVASHHVGARDTEKADEIANLLYDLSRTGSRHARRKLYDILVGDNLLDIIDAAFEKAADRGLRAEPHLHDFAVLLATGSPDRGPVKFGIALVGLIRDPADLEVIKTLGKHEEFTLFSAVAISSTAENPEADLFELAKVVDGWGKIHLVERLADTKDPTIRRWLIRDGYKNTIMNEYLAYACAVGGGLHQELAQESIDEELFHSAGEIIEALIRGGPAEDMDDYEHAAELIHAYLTHLSSFPKQIDHLLVLQALDGYLSDESWDDAAAESGGWTEGLRRQTLESVRRLGHQSEWTQLVHQALSSSDRLAFSNADRAARYLGIDTWDVHWTRLQSEPTEPSNWFSVMSLADHDRIDHIVAFATQALPLDEIATGPGEELGLGPAFQAHSCLDFVVQDLDRYPGKGERLVLAALASPVTRNRNMALKALSSWSLDERSEELNRALTRALSAEPVHEVRARIQQVLWGKVR